MATQEAVQAPVQTDDGSEEALISGWIAQNLGAQVARIERQGRWRPAWFVDAVRDGKPLPLYIRGERTENFLPYGLRREYEVHRTLEAGGIRVPRLHGYIEELPGSVMDVVPGRSNLFTCDDPAARASILEQLAQQVAAMHALDIEPFRKAGLAVPSEPRAVALSLFQEFYDNYARHQQRADPVMEFCAQWCLRNAPESDEPARFCASDAGQFMFDGDRLTAMMDFELSALGDPLIDLGAMRIRGQWEDLGDLPTFYRRYEELTGRKVDLHKVRYYTAAFSLSGAMASAICVDQYLAAPSDDADHVEYLCWFVWEAKQAIEAIGEYMGIALEKPAIPEPGKSPMNQAIFALSAALGEGDDGTAVGAYRAQVQRTIIAHKRLIDQYGAAFEREFLADAAALLDRSPATVEEADALLEDHVRAAGPESDEVLLHLLHRRICRQAWLLAVPGSHYYTGLTEPLLPI